MWIFYAFGSALFAGLTSILAKCGIRHTDSDVATAIRTIVVLIFSWIMVFVVGAQDGIAAVSGKTWLFLILSGLATGASWLCYFHALQAGDVNKVVPIDKSSTILTIVLAFLFLGEEVSALKIVCVILIGTGTFLMIQKKETEKSVGQEKKSWLLYACLSAVFASLTSILGKIGIEDDFAPHFEKFKRAVEIAKKLHTTRIRMFSFYIPEGKNPEIYHDTVIERIQKMVDYGEANGVHCCHENEKGIYGDTLERVEKLHKAIPALRCVFDPANYIQCGDDPAVNFKALAPIIDYMHIKDALFKDGSVVPAGEGDGSVPSILKALAETGKPYMLTLEPHLYDFSGLQNLQGEDVLHKRVYKDADEAFDVASDTLHDILKTIE